MKHKLVQFWYTHCPHSCEAGTLQGVLHAEMGAGLHDEAQR